MDEKGWFYSWRWSSIKIEQIAKKNTPFSMAIVMLVRVRLIAGFGGVLGRKCDGPPGPKARWAGMRRVREFALALDAGKAVYAGSG
ncbi:MAG TPA: IS4 family transposase [Saprospiraceae bacterium]|nr:IS4 family transposase [Saprospiraceae bacterium]